MKTVKIIISLLTVLLFCAALTACAKENKEQPKQDSAQVEAEQKEKDQDVRDQNAHIREPVEPKDDGGLASREQKAREQSDSSDEDDRIDTPEKDDGGLAEREQEAREQQEQAEQEQREQEQQQQQQSNGYEHHIGDAVFYTEHDLWKYIIPKETNPAHKWLDIETMLADVWGSSGTQVGNGYAFSDGTSFTAAVSYFDIDDNFANKRMVVSLTGGEKQYRSVITSWNTPKPDDNFLVIKGDKRGFGITLDMAAILLYVLEQSRMDPRSNIAGELGLPPNFECTY